MNEERNMLIFTNDEGDEIKLELLDYFLYEEEEYALLVAADEQDDEDKCDQDSCGNSECGCHGEEREIIVMKVLV
ncbi:MAG TPA: hypothetical protein VFD33_06045, partial [Bacillota bacterium]|nr:hypothetical protein [Bacillota bacterium]